MFPFYTEVPVPWMPDKMKQSLQTTLDYAVLILLANIKNGSYLGSVAAACLRYIHGETDQSLDIWRQVNRPQDVLGILVTVVSVGNEADPDGRDVGDEARTRVSQLPSDLQKVNWLWVSVIGCFRY